MLSTDYEEDSGSGSSGGELTPIKKNSTNQNDAQEASGQQQQSSSIISSLGSVLIVLSTALICFAAARNSITWYVHCGRNFPFEKITRVIFHEM